MKAKTKYASPYGQTIIAQPAPVEKRLRQFERAHREWKADQAERHRIRAELAMWDVGVSNDLFRSYGTSVLREALAYVTDFPLDRYPKYTAQDVFDNRLNRYFSGRDPLLDIEPVFGHNDVLGRGTGPSKRR